VLFVSLISSIVLPGSTTAEFTNEPLVAEAIEPTTMIVASAPGPMPSGPRSQSSVPPVTPSRSEHVPRLVLKLEYVNAGGGVSARRTLLAAATPMFRTWSV
jgi:hypothetical protein